MSKWVEVTVKSVNTYLVELEDDSFEEDASQVIIDCISYDWDEIDQNEVEVDEPLEDFLRQYDKDKIYRL